MSSFFSFKKKEIDNIIKKINKLDEKVKCYLATNNGSWFCLSFHVNYTQDLSIIIYQDKRIAIDYGGDIITEFEDIKESIIFLKSCFKTRKYMFNYLFKYFETICEYCLSIF